MSNQEQDRRAVTRSLEELIGDELAGKLMDMIPTHPPTELATRSDMQALTSQLRGEMAEVRGEMAELRGEMAELRAEVRGDIGELRAEMIRFRAATEGHIAELRADLKGSIQLEVGRLYRWGAGIIVANGIAVATALAT